MKPIVRIKLKTVAPRQGHEWVRAAFRVFASRALHFTALFGLFLLLASLLLALPFVGSLMLVAALPLLGLGFMIATASALRAGPVGPSQFIQPLRGPREVRRRLLGLCLLYALLTALIVVISDAVDDHALEQLQMLLASGRSDPAIQAEIDDLLTDNRLRNGMIIRLVLAGLVSVPFWHAPALVWWGGQGLAQALFSSTIALWRTRGAMTVFMITWLVLILALGGILSLLLTAIGARQFIGAAALPLGLTVSSVFYISLYFNFAQTFSASAGIDQTDESAPDEEQAEDARP